LPYEIGARNYRALADRLARETDIVREESTLRLRTHRVKLGESDGKLVARIEEELRKAEFQPPELKLLAEGLKLPSGEIAKLRSVLSALEREGKVVKVATDLYFARAPFDTAQKHLTGYLQTHPEITAAVYRDLLGASRKFAIALLDYFDHAGVTTRVGDARKLRR
jgi:selenocysteine-specific elongation factor